LAELLRKSKVFCGRKKIALNQLAPDKKDKMSVEQKLLGAFQNEAYRQPILKNLNPKTLTRNWQQRAKK
jgi:hypothetical protein